MGEDEVKKSDDSDEPVRTKLNSMWTPEMFDRFETDIRKLLEASTQYRDRSKGEEELVAATKKRAIEMIEAQKPK
jgi:hypothetical protein